MPIVSDIFSTGLLCSITNCWNSVKQGNVLPASNFKVNVLTQIQGKVGDAYVYRPASKVKRNAEAEFEAEPEMKVRRNANAAEEVPLVAPIKVAGSEDENF